MKSRVKQAAKPEAVSVRAAPEGFSLARGEDLLKTPAGVDFTVPFRPLAEALAEEWNAQSGNAKPQTMPLSRLAATAIDIIPRERGRIEKQLAGYAETDLLCHRAAHPQALAERQDKIWQPLLDWCGERFSAPLVTAIGLMPAAQPQASLDALYKIIGAYGDFRLAGLQQAADTAGSLVIGLALAERRIAVAEAFEAAELDNDFQIEKWGEDPAAASRRKEIKRELELCQRWFGLLEKPTAHP